MDIKYLSFLISFCLLASCSGGGGGSSSPSEPAVDLSASNYGDAGAFTLAYMEATLQIGRMTELIVDEVAATNTFPSLKSCENGGTVQYDFIDNDQSGGPSSGDTIRMDFSDCFQEAVDTVVDGLVVIDLQPTNVMPTGYSGFSANVDISDATLDVDGSIAVTVHGSLAVLFYENIHEQYLKVTPSGSQINYNFFDASTNVDEVLTGLTVTQRLSNDEGRYELEMTARVNSELLEFTFDISTHSPLSGFFQTYPDEGELSITTSTSTSTLSLLPNYVTDSELLQMSYRDSGIERVSEYNWNSLVEGFIWWHPGFDYGFSAWQLDINNFRLMDWSGRPPEEVEVGVNEAIVIQFTRPIEPSSVTSSIEYEPQNRWNEPPAATVIGTVEVSGALLIITPQTQLEHGYTYYLGGLSPEDQFGNTTGNVNYSFHTPDSLGAVAIGDRRFMVAGDLLQLSAVDSYAVGGSIVSYQWQELSALGVSITDSDQAEASVVLPAITEADELEVQLTVTNISGEQDSATVTLPVFPSLSGMTILSLVSDVGDYIGGGRDYFHTSAMGSFNFRRNFDNGVGVDYSDADGTRWRLELAAANDALLTVGAYENATRQPFQEITEPGLSFTGNGRGCNKVTGRFDILEVDYNTDGDVLALAVDFEQHCEGGSAALNGALRFNSAIAIPE